MSKSSVEQFVPSERVDTNATVSSLSGIDRLDLLSGASKSTSSNDTISRNPENLTVALGQSNIYQSVFDQPNSLTSDRVLPTLPKEPMLIADVVIHSGAEGQIPGHQSIEITNNIIGRMNYSFATDNRLAPSFGTGQVYFDEAGLAGPEERRYRLTPEQDRMVLDYLNERRSDWDGSRYSLSNRNCRTFVNEIEQFVRTLPQR